jgi:adenylate kinase
MGPPGSGKGTQGVRLAERLGVRHIAAGDLLRNEVEQGTLIGKRVSSLMSTGELVPDLVIVALLIPELLRAGDDGGYVLDGYPRSVAQAELVRDLVDRMDLSADVAVLLDVPEDELIRRILARAAIEGRADDTEEVVANRLKVYTDATSPLIEYYRDRGVLHVIDAVGSMDDITEKVFAAVASSTA